MGKLKTKGDQSRVAGPFVAMPHHVLNSKAYLGLSHIARSLLMEIAMQFNRQNNGKLILTRDYLAKRGWNSNDSIHKAKAELLNARLIHQTVAGRRPHKASWFAICWDSLNTKDPAFDEDLVDDFRKGSYENFIMPKPAPTKEVLYEKWHEAGAGKAPVQ